MKHATHAIVTKTNRQLAHLKNTVGEKNRKLFFMRYHAGRVLGRRVQSALQTNPRETIYRNKKIWICQLS